MDTFDRTGVSRSSDPADEERARAFAIHAARSLRDDKCEDVLVLDLRTRSQVTDFFVIASGTSERQMRAAAKHIEETSTEHNFEAHRHNLGDRESNWLVIDFVDVVVHVFEPDARLFYDLEMLWGDAERLAWDDGGGHRPKSVNRAGLRRDDVLPDGE